MNFVERRYLTFSFAIVLAVLAIIFLITPGLNYGIDFTGGTLLERQVAEDVTVEEIRSLLSGELAELNIANATIQLLENPNEFVIRTRELSNAEIGQVDQALASNFGDVEIRRTDMVGPVVGKELIRQSLIALVLASIGILIYIAIRFEFRFAVSAIIALMYDVIVVLGVFAISGKEINSAFIAAILTVVGYSINNTIVVFDRIRSHLKTRKKESLAELVNTSLEETLPRTINTGLTTFVTVFLLYLFGGSAISDFAFALVVGLISGTFTSLFLSGQIWLEWNARAINS